MHGDIHLTKTTMSKHIDGYMCSIWDMYSQNLGIAHNKHVLVVYQISSDK